MDVYFAQACIYVLMDVAESKRFVLRASLVQKTVSYEKETGNRKMKMKWNTDKGCTLDQYALDDI